MGIQRLIRDTILRILFICVFFFLGRILAIPMLVEGVTFGAQYAFLAALAIWLGPVSGGIIGFLGSLMVDLSYGNGICWSWLLPGCAFGVAMGIYARQYYLNISPFDKRLVLRFNVIQASVHVACWLVAAPLLDMLFYGVAAGTAFLRGLVAAGGNIVSTAVLGTLLLYIYTLLAKKGVLFRI